MSVSASTTAHASTPPATPEEPLAVDLDRLTAPIDAVERTLATFLKNRPLPHNLREAIEYALLGGGKRMRPVLALQASAAVGGALDSQSVLAAAGAIEMIHAFSLVHDDLPAMDDDDLRRGRPTLHRHTSDAMAILAGDGMMALAVELITTRVAESPLCCRLVHELVKGTNDMIAGQVYDTLPDFDQATTKHERLLTIHKHKTGALLRAACRMGAMAGGGDDSQVAAVSRYAEAVGLMFQIVDDLLDVTQTAEQMGKATGKDADMGKLTYPGVLGVEASRAEVARLRAEAHAALEPLDDSAMPLGQLCDYMAVRTK